MIKYTDVRGETREEYAVMLLAYASERLERTITVHGADSEQFAKAVERWAQIIALQVKMWPNDHPMDKLDFL